MSQSETSEQVSTRVEFYFAGEMYPVPRVPESIWRVARAVKRWIKRR